MNALFALALLVSPSQAGVVMPVKTSVAPSGPSAVVVPVLSPTGGSIGSPMLGAALDLRGGLPLLPSPVPGLAGPAIQFVGNEVQAAAVRAESGAAHIAVPLKEQGRAAVSDKTPSLPAKTVVGAPSLALSRDRLAAAATSEKGVVLTRKTVLEHARPESAAGLGREFFDQSTDADRSTLADPSGVDDQNTGSSLIERHGRNGSDGLLTLNAASAGAAFSAGHGLKLRSVSYAPDGEVMRDAVASIQPGPATLGGAGAAVTYFRFASPNGDVGASVGATRIGGLLRPAAPRPLALDLSRSGLIVRVRSALNGIIAPAPAAATIGRFVSPGPSTALLERGAMLEAFSVAHAYAEAEHETMKVRGGQASAPIVPLEPTKQFAPSLWWAWLALPLFAAAIRGIL